MRFCPGCIKHCPSLFITRRAEDEQPVATDLAKDPETSFHLATADTDNDARTEDPATYVVNGRIP